MNTTRRRKSMLFIALLGAVGMLATAGTPIQLSAADACPTASSDPRCCIKPPNNWNCTGVVIESCGAGAGGSCVENCTWTGCS